MDGEELSEHPVWLSSSEITHNNARRATEAMMDVNLCSKRRQTLSYSICWGKTSHGTGRTFTRLLRQKNSISNVLVDFNLFLLESRLRKLNPLEWLQSLETILKRRKFPYLTDCFGRIVLLPFNAQSICVKTLRRHPLSCRQIDNADSEGGMCSSCWVARCQRKVNSNLLSPSVTKR